MLSAIVSSVVFLEASINEMMSAAEEVTAPVEWGLTRAELTLLHSMWRLGTDKAPVLRKYETALVLLGKLPLESDRNPSQDAGLLVKLRNDLVHYKPEWIAEERAAVAAVQKPDIWFSRLSERFASNPLAHPSMPYYPSGMLGHGCAAWSVQTALAFSRAFYERAGIRYPYRWTDPVISTDLAWID